MSEITVWPAIGIEVSADRSRTWVARAADLDGRTVVELLDPVPGTTAVLELLAQWRQAWEVISFAIDPRSPSATLVAPLTATRLPLKTADAHAMAVAHGTFQDLLTGGLLRIRGHEALDQAGRQAQERRLAGSQAVDRYQGVDSAPLVAAELAAWAHLIAPRSSPTFIARR